MSELKKITLDGVEYDLPSGGEGGYIKPDDGIPKSDLNQSVQDSLDKADTALQSFTETDPTVPSHVKSITEMDISNWNGKAEISDIPNVPSWALEETKPTYTASEVGALPDDTVIPEQLTEADILDMGFTKNTGTYIKPESGIPKSDLSEEVQDSLDKAETDPTVPAHVKSITETDISNWNDKQDKLTAGDNITIEDGVISATGGSAPDNVVLHSPSEEEVEVPPIDADKLGGELPEYYAKQSDINATNEAVNNINVYVGEDSMLHFVNGEGADSVIPFSNGAYLDMVDNTAIPANYTFTEDYDLVMLSAWSSSGGDIIWTYNGQGLMSQKIGSAENSRSGYACLLINVKAGDTISRNKGDTTSCYKFKYVGGKPSPKQRFSRFEYLGDHTSTERTITATNGLKAVLGVIWNYNNTRGWNYYKNTAAQLPWTLNTGGNNRSFSSCVITPLLEGDSISFPQASSQNWFWLGVY